MFLKIYNSKILGNFYTTICSAFNFNKVSDFQSIFFKQ